MTLRDTLRRYASRWLPVVLWMAFIFYLSAQPTLSANRTKVVGGPLTAVTVPAASSSLLLRPLAHFGLYFVLSILLRRASNGQKYGLILTLLVSAVYAATDEVHKSFVPGRQGRLIDVMTDLAGAGAFLILAASFGRFIIPRIKAPVAARTGPES